MIKKIRKKACVLVSSLCMLFGIFHINCPQNTIYASEVSSEEETSVDEQELPYYDIASATVQVVLVYLDENSNYHILQSGSGILVDPTNVITSKQMTILSDTNKAEAAAYLSELLGKKVSFEDTQEEGVQVISPTLAIVEEADIYNIASVTFASSDWDVALLSLTTATNKSCAVLGDSDSIQPGHPVAISAFPTATYSNPVSFTVSDVYSGTGNCITRENGDINHDIAMEPGNAGGAIVDEYGRVVGVASYTCDAQGKYQALAINQVKGYLDRYNVSYTENADDYSNLPAPDQTSGEHVTDKSELYKEIQEAQMIIDEEDKDDYTTDSYRKFKVEFDCAKQIYDDDAADQKKIDEATLNLAAAIKGLEEVKRVNIVLIVIIVVSSLVVIAGIVFLIIFLNRRKKKKKNQQTEKQKIKTMAQGDSASRNNSAMLYQSNVSAINKMQNVGLPSSQLYAQFDAKASDRIAGVVQENNSMIPDNNLGTTVLCADVGTTILNTAIPEPVTAYLYQVSTGQNIAITGEEFILGKDYQGVSYRIDGNSNVSRKHAKITRKYDDYFIEDTNSTNGTFVNSRIVAPGYRQVLTPNDIIHLGDEEFVFMKNS